MLKLSILNSKLVKQLHAIIPPGILGVTVVFWFSILKKNGMTKKRKNEMKAMHLWNI